MGVLAQC